MKPTENDLTRVAERAGIFTCAWIGSVFPVAILFAILAQRVSTTALYDLSTPVYDGVTVFLVLVFALSSVPGVLLLRFRTVLILRCDFGYACSIDLVGRVLRGFAFAAIGAFALVAVADHVLQMDPLRQLIVQLGPYIGFVLIAGLSVFGVGGVMDLYFDAFAPITLAKLCFGQARDVPRPVSKLRMMRGGIKSIRLGANEFGLDFDGSRFERLYAIRLLDGQNVDAEFDRVSARLSSGSVLDAITEMGTGAPDLLGLRRTRRQRVAALLDSVKGYAQILVAVAALLSLVAAWKP